MRPAPIRDSFEIRGYRRHRGTDWIEKNWSTLPPDHWVAADGKSLVITADDIDELMHELDRQNIQPDEVSIVFISPLAV
ncbi:hypothetical protein [Caballeronia sp. KNU42]